MGQQSKIVFLIMAIFLISLIPVYGISEINFDVDEQKLDGKEPSKIKKERISTNKELDADTLFNQVTSVKPVIELSSKSRHREPNMVFEEQESEFLPRSMPNWVLNPAEFEFTGSIVVGVLLDNIRVGHEGDMLAAFVDGEVRGIQTAVFFPPANEYVFMLQVYSNELVGETLTFQYYDSITGEIYYIIDTTEFEFNMIIGDAYNPLELNAYQEQAYLEGINDQSVNINEDLTFEVLVVGSVYGEVSVDVEGLQDWMIFEDMIFTANPSAENVGEYELVFTASDENGEFFETLMVLSVLNVDTTSPVVIIVTHSSDDHNIYLNFYSADMDSEILGYELSIAHPFSDGFSTEEFFDLTELIDCNAHSCSGGIIMPSNYGYGNYGIQILSENEAGLIGESEIIAYNLYSDISDVDDPCYDSDNTNFYGIDYYKKGLTLGFNYDFDAIDACVDENTVREGFCYDGLYAQYDYACPGGCFKGACVPVPDPVPRLAPAWFVNPAEYEYSASVVATAFVEGVQVNNENDVLAAFVDGQVRGVANAIYFPPADQYVWMMPIYSNNVEGETVTFVYYNSEENEVFEMEETLLFQANLMEGDAFDPFVLNSADDEFALTFDFVIGWNSFSINVEQEDMSVNNLFGDVIFVDGDEIITYDAHAIYNDGEWIPDIEINPTRGYRMLLSQAKTLSIEGEPVDVNTPITLIGTGDASVTWIGYLPQESRSVEEVMAGVTSYAIPSKVLDIESGLFSQYAEGVWFGSLEEMQPGEMYKITTALPGTLIYGE
ncbi:hypothetical protein ISS09_05435 [Candidatus Woesearchaeota archaeon]|nr:hypothetical protein [Candidatus Woesearchaeota archaeon]